MLAAFILAFLISVSNILLGPLAWKQVPYRPVEELAGEGGGRVLPAATSPSSLPETASSDGRPIRDWVAPVKPALIAAQSSPTPPEVLSEAAVLYDPQTGAVYFEKNAFTPKSVASLTKIMTIYLAAKAVDVGKLRFQESVRIGEGFGGVPEIKLGLTSGQVIQADDLLYSSALISANDAAIALADRLAGSEAEFTYLMNQEAGRLGLERTSFMDSTGLLSEFSGNFSTAYDIARLAGVALQNPLFAQVVGTKTYRLKAYDEPITNSNELLFNFRGAEGVKTGVTDAAGQCLAAAASRDGWRLIAVILGAETREQRFEEAASLLEWGFGHLRRAVRAGEKVARVKVRGSPWALGLAAERELRVFVQDPRNAVIVRRPTIPSGPALPVHRGDKLGELVIIADGREAGKTDLVAGRTMRREGFWGGLVDWVLAVLHLL